ncbi:hypothetical protein [Bacillus sp. JJ722]|uniref:hypothetical protein n=1 Tax=Bacillus sp. JJ722 TaxID=3122973 RepID=UPI002FFEA347
MDDNQKIHILTRELIHVINNLEDDTKKVVIEHIHYCTECQQLYSKLMEVEKNYPQVTISNENENKPLKKSKSVQFNRGLKLLLIFIRAVILFYIIFSGLSFYDWEISSQAAIDYIQGVTFLFYFPAAIFLIIFTITFFNKKWIWTSLIFDLIITFIYRSFNLIFYHFPTEDSFLNCVKGVAKQ